MSLRGFVGYRGNVRMIRADNGSNIVGVYLNHAFQEMDHIKMEKKLTTIVQHRKSLGTPDLECKSNFKFLTEDLK